MKTATSPVNTQDTMRTRCTVRSPARVRRCWASETSPATSSTAPRTESVTCFTRLSDSPMTSPCLSRWKALSGGSCTVITEVKTTELGTWISSPFGPRRYRYRVSQWSTRPLKAPTEIVRPCSNGRDAARLSPATMFAPTSLHAKPMVAPLIPIAASTGLVSTPNVPSATKVPTAYVEDARMREMRDRVAGSGTRAVRESTDE
mmetsp:Transcript_54216/g.166808  ORF Transcript_54216/g.166808 Transcript_54216/m.166808 type:complete len:203 (-) Transcript_54216:103-711(-)